MKLSEAARLYGGSLAIQLFLVVLFPLRLGQYHGGLAVAFLIGETLPGFLLAWILARKWGVGVGVTVLLVGALLQYMGAVSCCLPQIP